MSSTILMKSSTYLLYRKKTLPYANEYAFTDQLKFWPEVKKILKKPILYN